MSEQTATTRRKPRQRANRSHNGRPPDPTVLPRNWSLVRVLYNHRTGDHLTREGVSLIGKRALAKIAAALEELGITREDAERIFR